MCLYQVKVSTVIYTMCVRVCVCTSESLKLSLHRISSLVRERRAHGRALSLSLQKLISSTGFPPAVN